jgi:hypothetical protein
VKLKVLECVSILDSSGFAVAAVPQAPSSASCAKVRGDDPKTTADSKPAHTAIPSVLDNFIPILPLTDDYNETLMIGRNNYPLRLIKSSFEGLKVALARKYSLI